MLKIFATRKYFNVFFFNIELGRDYFRGGYCLSASIAGRGFSITVTTEALYAERQEYHKRKLSESKRKRRSMDFHLACTTEDITLKPSR